MATTGFRAILLAILFVDAVICVDPPAFAPNPAPELGADGPSAPAPSVDDEAIAHTPSDSPFSSPPSPSPDLGESPAPSPATASDSAPVPGPSVSDIVEDHSESKGKGGRKAGIAFGVIAAAGLVGGAGCVLKKRRDNERRAQYGHAMRRELL